MWLRLRLRLERVRQKWIPVLSPDTRKNKRLESVWRFCHRQTDSKPEGSRFLPVEIVAAVKAPPAPPDIGNRIEIDLAGGHRLRISGYDPEALVRLIRGLST